MFFKKKQKLFPQKKDRLRRCYLPTFRPFRRQKFQVASATPRRVKNKMDLSPCRPFPRQSLRLFSKQIRVCVAHVFHKHPPRVRFFHSIIPGHLCFFHSITFVFFTAPTFIFFTASLFFSRASNIHLCFFHSIIPGHNRDCDALLPKHIRSCGYS